MRTIPVDLILHCLVDTLRDPHMDSAQGMYATAIARCIDARRVAEDWESGGEAMQYAIGLLSRLAGEVKPGTVVTSDTRTVEVAVARRLADTAFALMIEQDEEATDTARTLLRAAQAIVGLKTTATVEEARAYVEVHKMHT